MKFVALSMARAQAVLRVACLVSALLIVFSAGACDTSSVGSGENATIKKSAPEGGMGGTREVSGAMTNQPSSQGASQAEGTPATGLPKTTPAPKSARAPLPVVVPDEVKKSVKKVKLRLKKKDGSWEKVFEVALGEETKLGDSGLAVTAQAYLPAFYMDQARITSVGAKPTNPACKVVVKENGKDIHSGWLFSKMPAVHAFTHEKYVLTLVEAIVEEEKAE